jgi:NADH-quinone oxidoreductase subunit L
MTLVVTGVGSLIHIYAIGYMHDDERFQRFFVYLNLFVFAMLLLVLSDNFLGMFVGWEGVGLASYLLIGFWFDRRDDLYGWYADAGKKAFLVNRIGDFGMLIAIFAIWTAVGSLNFLEVFEAAEAGMIAAGVATLICLMLLLAASGKSAQIPLFVWLPDAMAGPTPVSALIHAATMVTAGIYMIARTHALWYLSPLASDVTAWIGVLTALLAGSIALVQTDLKKVLAYSTVSQLGYMILGVGVGAYAMAVFHLITHAFFKALLFLSAGSVQHAAHELDMRKLGGLREKMPHTYRVFLLGGLALAGFPLFSGFFSKDGILLFAFKHNPALYAVGIVAALFTAFYTFRAVFMTFHGKPRDAKIFSHVHESEGIMIVPLYILAFFAVTAGVLNLPKILTLEHWLEPSLGHPHEVSLVLELALMSVGALVALTGIYMAYARYVRHESWTERLAANFSAFQKPLDNKWYVDELYMAVIVNPLRALSEWFAHLVDKLAIDGIVNGVGSVLMWSGGRLRYLNNGLVPTYALSIFVGVAALVAYFVFG